MKSETLSRIGRVCVCVCVWWSLSPASLKDIWWNRFLLGRGVCMCSPNTWWNEGLAASGSEWGWTLYASRPAKDTAHVPLNPVMTSASTGRQTPVLRAIPDGKLTTPGMQRMTQHSASYVMVNLERSGRDDITAKVSSHPAMGRGVNQSQIEQGGERTNTLRFQLCMLWQNHFHGEISPNSSPGQQFPDN